MKELQEIPEGSVLQKAVVVLIYRTPEDESIVYTQDASTPKRVPLKNGDRIMIDIRIKGEDE